MVVNMREAAQEEGFPNMKLEIKKKQLSELGKCFVCLKACENIGTSIKSGETKAYCGLCLPSKYITKPVRSWLCNICALEATKLGDS